MSKLTRERLELDPKQFSTANVRRTPGLHLTPVIKEMLVALMGEYKKNAAFGEKELNAAALQGFLWEDVVTETLKNRVRRSSGSAIGIDPATFVRLPEIATDGERAFFVDYDEHTNELITPIPDDYIVMSPDGGILGNDGLRLLEVKWLMKSATMTPERDRPDWLWQVPCYMRGLSLAYGEPVNIAEWHVQFSCGEYRVRVISDSEGRIIPISAGPIYERWTRPYSQQEQADRFGAVYQFAVDNGMFERAKAEKGLN